MLTYYTDPGHGWLRVTLTDLADLNMMAGDFSQYSYRQGNYVYLEENCDAGKFIDAYKEKHGHEPEMCHIHTDHDSIIRSMPRITPVRTHRAPTPMSPARN